MKSSNRNFFESLNFGIILFLYSFHFEDLNSKILKRNMSTEDIGRECDKECADPNICQDHLKPRLLFCQKCQIEVCINCALLAEHDHSSHVFVNLKTAGTKKILEPENVDHVVRDLNSICLIPYQNPAYERMKKLVPELEYTVLVNSFSREFGIIPPGLSLNYQILITNLPLDVYEDSLIIKFQEYGKVCNSYLIMDPLTGQHRGTALITFSQQETVDKILNDASAILKEPFEGMKLFKMNKDLLGELYGEHVCVPCDPFSKQSSRINFCSCIMESLETIDKLVKKISITRKLFIDNDLKFILDAIDSKTLSQCAHHTVVMEVGEDDGSIENVISASLDIVNRKTLDSEYLNHVHKTIMPHDTTAGQYKKLENVVLSIYGLPVVTNLSRHVPIKMKEFFACIKEMESTSIHAVIAAALLKFQFLRIHPYCDGNGRMSRIIMSWFLKHRNASYPWILFPIEEKYAYFQALHSAQKLNDANVTLFLKYTCHVVLESCNQYYKTLRRFTSVLK